MTLINIINYLSYFFRSLEYDENFTIDNEIREMINDRILSDKRENFWKSLRKTHGRIDGIFYFDYNSLYNLVHSSYNHGYK